MSNNNRKYTLILGGAGFIGSNLANRLLKHKQAVMVFDNLSRPGVEQNLRWLRETHGDTGLLIEVSDICDRRKLVKALSGASAVFHFAAQVAVTTSLADPFHDFNVNVCGTMYLLEALRALDTPPSLIFTSTNKVYGRIGDIRLRAVEGRYEPDDFSIRRSGISELCRLDFQSPYGCSKGSADQYVIDYARSFKLPAAVFRMSCIYGPHQQGTEDQGWIAHFLIRALEERPITIYGDGRQVRDALFIDDLVDALLLAQRNIRQVAGEAFNIGGGPSNTLSLLELIEIIDQLCGCRPDLIFEAWRSGDQQYFVSDTRKFKAATGWAPKTAVRTGIELLHKWLALSRVPRARKKEQHEICVDQS